MTILRRFLPFLLLASFAAAQEGAVAARPAPSPIPPDDAHRIQVEGITKSQAMRILRDMTGKIGHRLTGSDNFTKACEWARAEFAAMGLSNVHLEQWGEWKLVWNRGAWVGRITEPMQLDMYVATDAWTAGTKGLQKGLVVKAPAPAPAAPAAPAEGAAPGTSPGPDGPASGAGSPPVAPAEAAPAKDAAAAAAPVDFAGKWVISRRRPSAAVRKTVEAGGALGVVYCANDPIPAYPTRVRVFGNNQTAMKGIEQVPTMPEIAVRADDFDKLFELVDSGKEVTCEFNIENEFRQGPIALHNVIAEIPGTEKPDEVVIISAHLDSWHQAQGCTDNGTGSATTLEAARILSAAGVQPKRTIRFCLWGGEEQGLLGSAAYVRKHRTEMEKVSAVFNHDTGTNWAQSLGVTAEMKEQLAPIFATVNDLLKAPDADWEGPVFELRTVQRVAGGGGSDHASFLAAGVPGLDWGLKGRSNYFQHTWHTQWDTIDVAIEEYQRHTSTVVALAALGTANLDARLDRKNVGGATGPGQSIVLAAGWFEAEFDGMTFAKVTDGGRAAKMGVQKGDVLKKVAGQDVEGHRQIFQFAREAEGDAVTFTFQRGEKVFEATAKKDELPARQRRGEAPPAAAPAAPGSPATPAPTNPPNTTPPNTPPPQGDG